MVVDKQYLLKGEFRRQMHVEHETFYPPLLISIDVAPLRKLLGKLLQHKSL